MGDAQRSCTKGLTMLEMIISLAIIVVIFAVMLPQFKNMQNSWASKRAMAEAIQNGRILIEYLNRNLTKAARITAVSDPCDTTGYIEFEGNDDITYRFDVAANNYVEFGPVGNLVELGGPVSQLQFTCYDAHDLDTPITTVGEIRCVNVEITLTNAGGGQDQTFTAKAYLRTNAIAGSGLIAHWKFDEGSGAVAADSGAYNYNATIVGPAWITGDSCVWLAQATQAALDFDGLDDYVDIDSEITGPFDELTLAAWVKFRDDNSLYAAIFSSDAATDYTELGFPEDNGWLEFEVSVGGDRFGVIAADTDITLGQWYHVAATYDNSEPALAKLYIDGRLASQASQLSHLPAVIDSAAIGVWNENSVLLQRFFDGAIDDFRIYNRALTAADVAQLAGTRAGLVGYWKFDETTGASAADSSGNNIDVTVSGADWESGGWIDGALDFDGNDDYVDTTILGNSITDVTFSLWFQSDDAGSIGDNRVAQRFFTQVRSGSNTRLAVGINNNKLAVYWRYPSHDVGEGATTLSGGRWYHAALTYDGSDIRIYLDGTEENSFPESNMSESSAGTIEVGWDPGQGGRRYFDGLLDDVRIYRRALTATEIQAIYNRNEYCCSVEEQILP